MRSRWARISDAGTNDQRGRTGVRGCGDHGRPEPRSDGHTYRFAAIDGLIDRSPADEPAAEAVDPVDDPATSPYPIWRASKVYEAGDKVVWHRDVYEAKWWTQGDLPDEPVVNVWDSPWRYLGPVLPGEEPGPPEPDESSDAYPAWDPDTVYDTGDRVSHDDVDFEAKWWNTGTAPDPDPDVPWELVE